MLLACVFGFAGLSAQETAEQNEPKQEMSAADVASNDADVANNDAEVANDGVANNGAEVSQDQDIAE